MLRIFRHYVPRVFLVTGIVELLVFILSLYIGVHLRFTGVEFSSEIEPLFPKALVFALAMLLVMTAFGLYKRNLQEGLGGMIFRIGMSFAVGFVIMSMIFYISEELFLGRGAFGIAFGFAFIGVLIVRFMVYELGDRNAMKRRILVLGAGKKAKEIAELEKKEKNPGYVIIGYVHIAGQHDVVPKENVIKYDRPLMEFTDEMEIDEVVVALDDRRKQFPVHELLDCKMSGVQVVDVLSFFERQTGKVHLDILQPSWLIFSDGFQQGMLRSVSKRVFDILVSALIILIAMPVIILTMIAIRVEDRGPVFYRQVRVGENWRLFQVLKFRSMRTDAEKKGAQWATKNDSRVTRVGKIIRILRIDELPQVINVFKGDMSFVGPRPERPEFVEKFSETIPYYAERHRVKPGITGWAQICCPYAASEKETVEKLQYDLYYVKNYSVFLDFMIIFQTAEVVLWGRGAR